MVRITVLSDNRKNTADDPCLISEHGLSLYIEAGDCRILCDMGASDVYRSNAAALGVDLNSLDFAFVSHGHNDHTGGLGDFLRTAPHTPVYMSSHIFGHRFYSARRTAPRDISTPGIGDGRYMSRFCYVENSCWLASGVAVVKCDCEIYQRPRGNRFLLCDGQQDDFRHELSLAIVTSGGLVVVSPCSHSGAVNIIDSCRRFTGENQVVAFVGGLHFVDGEDVGREVAGFINDVSTLCPEMQVITGHCTCDAALEALCVSPRTSALSVGLLLEF